MARTGTVDIKFNCEYVRSIPFASLRLTDGGSRGQQQVEVIVSGECVAYLPVTEATYKLGLDSKGILTVSTHADTAIVNGLALHG